MKTQVVCCGLGSHDNMSGESQEDIAMKSQGEGGRRTKEWKEVAGVETAQEQNSAFVKDITRLLKSCALKSPGNYLKVYTSGYKCGALKAPRHFFLAKTSFPCH